MLLTWLGSHILQQDISLNYHLFVPIAFLKKMNRYTPAFISLLKRFPPITSLVDGGDGEVYIVYPFRSQCAGIIGCKVTNLLLTIPVCIALGARPEQGVATLPLHISLHMQAERTRVLP